MPVANPVADIVQCAEGLTTSFVLNSQDAIILGTQVAADFTISYHLTATDATVGVNSLSFNYTNTSAIQTIYARVENKLNRGCFAVTSFKIIARQNPVLNITDVYSICEGSSIVVTAPSGFDSYLWSNGDITNSTTITNDGNYSVTVTKNYGDIICDSTQNFVVYKSNKATITQIKIEDWTSHDNSIQIFVSGDGEYEYSIDGLIYQDNAFFTNLPSGSYTIYVRDKKGCGVVKEEVYLLTYPKFFTPNGDGIHDTWKIEFAEKDPNLTYAIFDRFGKLLKTMNATSNGWDGNYLGEKLPATDYWFVIQREKGREFRGHFNLKR